MRGTVLYRGDPIGTSNLMIQPPFAIGTLERFAGYDALRPVFRERSRAMRNLGFLPPVGAETGGVNAIGDAAGAAAVARARELCDELALRADDGTAVVLESLEIVDLPEQSEITLFGFVPDDGSAVTARVPSE